MDSVFHCRMNRQPNHDRLQRNTDLERFFFFFCICKEEGNSNPRLPIAISNSIRNIIMQKFHPMLWSTIIAMCALAFGQYIKHLTFFSIGFSRPFFVISSFNLRKCVFPNTLECANARFNFFFG